MADDGLEKNDSTTSVDLAYGLVPIAYDWTVRRLNAVEGRIQALMVFSSGFIITGPALVAVGEASVSLNSTWFYLALVMAAGNLVAGVFVRSWGSIQILGLNNVKEVWLQLSPAEFKHAAVWYAAQHFESNISLVNRKSTVALCMAFAFLLETAFLMVWGLTQLG